MLIPIQPSSSLTPFDNMPKVQKKREKDSHTHNIDSPTKWIPPSSGCTIHWTRFLMAKERDLSFVVFV